MTRADALLAAITKKVERKRAEINEGLEEASYMVIVKFAAGIVKPRRLVWSDQEEEDVSG